MSDNLSDTLTVLSNERLHSMCWLCCGLFFDVVPCFVLCFLSACFVVENVNIFEFVGCIHGSINYLGKVYIYNIINEIL